MKKFLLYGGIFLFFIVLLWIIYSQYSTIKRLDNNLNANTQVIQRVENGYNTWSTRLNQLDNIRDLKESNRKLYEQIRNIRNEIRYVTQTEVIYLKDTIYIDNEVIRIDSNTFNLSYNYIDSVIKFKNETFLDIEHDINGFNVVNSYSRISDLQVKMDLIVGIRKINRHNEEIFVRPLQNGIIVGRLEGYTIKRKRENITATVGPFAGLGYNPINGNLTPQIGLGINVGFRLFGF